jgi:hypothetical protein
VGGKAVGELRAADTAGEGDYAQTAAPQIFFKRAIGLLNLLFLISPLIVQTLLPKARSPLDLASLSTIAPQSPLGTRHGSPHRSRFIF